MNGGRWVTRSPIRALGAVRRVDGQPGFMLEDPDGRECKEATQWLLQLVANGCSAHTVRAYAMSLLRFRRFGWSVGCPSDQVTDQVARDFVLWAKEADKFVGAKKAAGPRSPVNRVTGSNRDRALVALRRGARRPPGAARPAGCCSPGSLV